MWLIVSWLEDFPLAAVLLSSTSSHSTVAFVEAVWNTLFKNAGEKCSLYCCLQNHPEDYCS